MADQGTHKPQQETIQSLAHELYQDRQGQKLSRQEILRRAQDDLFSERAEKLEEDQSAGTILGALDQLPDGEYSEQELLQRLTQIVQSGSTVQVPGITRC